MHPGEMTPDFDASLAEATSITWDSIVVGAGHNGLVAALVLSRAGRKVLVVEARPGIGGAARTERPFARAPGLSTSTGAYLVGLVQPELLARLQIRLPLIRRDPHYFLPTTEGSRHLLLGSDRNDLERRFRRFSSASDYRAHCALSTELAQIREDVAPTWLSPPVSVEETADRHVRPALRQRFVELCRGSVLDYLDRFGFESDLVKAMYAVTDGFAGLYGAFRSPGSGMNFLVHNMCRLPGADGTWMLPRGGMGAVSGAFAEAAARAGARLLRGTPVSRIECASGSVESVVIESGERLRARSVVAGCDPFTLRRLVGPETFPPSFNAWLDARQRPGSSLKLNLALDGLPRFSCRPGDDVPFRGTIHLLPDEARVMRELDAAFASTRAGRLPEQPAIEWYVHSTVDPSLTDEKGRLSSALFVQWVPYSLEGSTWEREQDAFADRLLAICDRFAPGTSSRVVDRLVLHPRAIEARFGMSYGHIHHLDNAFGFNDRFPHRTPVGGLYSCSAGTHPAGSVIGSAGYIASRLLLSDLGVSA